MPIPWSPHSGPRRSAGQTPSVLQATLRPRTLLTAPPGGHPWPCGQSPRAADLQEVPHPNPAREARRDGDCGQVLTAPPPRPSSLQVSCTPLPNVSPSLRAHDLSYFLPSFTPEPEPEKSSPGQPATPNSPGGRTHPCWVPEPLPAAANEPFIKYPLVPSAGVCHLSPARTVTGKYKNQTHHSRISLLESTCHNMCMLRPLQFLQVIEDSVQQRGKCHKTSILIYSTVYLESTEFIFLKSEASFPT